MTVHAIDFRWDDEEPLGRFYARVRDVVRQFDGVTLSDRIAVLSVVKFEMEKDFYDGIKDDL